MDTRAWPLVLATALIACGGAASIGPVASAPTSPSPAGTSVPGPSVVPSPPTAVPSATAVVVSATAGVGTATAGIVTATAVAGGTIRPNATPAPAPRPTPTPSPAPGGLAQAQLKYRIVDQVGRPLFCDPDFYPVARVDEQAQADLRFSDIQADGPTFSAILAHLGIAPAATYSAERRLAVYREWKMLSALRLDPVGAAYRFSIYVATSGGTASQVFHVDGTIDPFGTIAVASRTPSVQPPCPICLARGTTIGTPGGEVAVEDLRVGDAVWTLGEGSERLAAVLIRVGSTEVPPTHEVIRLALDDGRVVRASPGHPTADGRRVGDLVPGDVLDGAQVAAAERVRYDGGATFDVLPDGPTGVYWANGVLLGSTLR